MDGTHDNSMCSVHGTILICIFGNCQARGPDHVQVNSGRLQGLKKLLVILKSQGLDQEIDSIIGIFV